MRKTLNKALLRRLAKKLRGLRHEEHYDQRELAKRTGCGTAACIAGHAVIEMGWRPLIQKSGVAWECIKGKATKEIADVAADGLGLTNRQASTLFVSEPDDGWPQPYADRWLDRYTTCERPSRIAADLLDALAAGEVSL